MNLSDKLNFIIRKLRPGIIAMIPVFLGCETSDDIGIRYQLESGANVNFEEWTLPTTNLIVDSLRTDSENELLVGRYTDEIVGSVVAESYFTLRVRSTNLPSDAIATNFVLDSLRMSFEAVSSASSNDLVTQSFNVHLLNDTLTNLVYLSSKSETLGQTVGSFSTSQSLSDNDTIRGNFLMDNAFSLSVFNNFAKDESVLSQTNWPSMAISPTNESNVMSEISLLDDTTGLYLYVTHPEGLEKIIDGDTFQVDTTYVVEFGFFASSTNPGYVNLKRDRSGSELSGLSDNDRVDLSNGNTLIEPLAGVTTLLSVQPLIDFFNQLDQENRTIIINNATISFQIESETIRDTLENFYSFNYRNNDFFGPALVNNTLSSVMLGDNTFLLGQTTPALSGLNEDESSIVISASLFFQSLYAVFREEKKFLVPNLPEDNQIEFSEFVLISREDVTLNRSIFSNGGTTLRLYYTEVN